MWSLYALALLAGLASAVQPGQNASLARALAHPSLAGIVSFLVALLAIAVGMLATGRIGLPSAAEVAAVPWWAWLGGVCAAVLTVAQLTVSKRIGAAPFLGLLVTAGVVTSIGLDHFGLVGFKEHAAGIGRLVGGALMIAGVTLVAVF